MWKDNLKLKVKYILHIFNKPLFSYFVAAIFLSGISGLSALIGFGATVASARKQDPKYFSIGMTPMKELPETGASLALRALGWGSLYAFVGCGVLFYSIWKISGANNV